MPGDITIQYIAKLAITVAGRTTVVTQTYYAVDVREVVAEVDKHYPNSRIIYVIPVRGDGQ
jgi:hypothetical protein